MPEFKIPIRQSRSVLGFIRIDSESLAAARKEVDKLIDNGTAYFSTEIECSVEDEAISVEIEEDYYHELACTEKDKKEKQRRDEKYRMFATEKK